MAKKNGLQISSLLSLPLDTVTSTMIVYGGKGMGKSNFGTVLAEEMSAEDLRWSVIDPMGVWWGIRHAADGKGKGVECLILGGPHGDIPIEPTGGAVIADMVVDHRVNVIIDISRKTSGEAWSIGERIRFVTEYGRQLNKRQSGLLNGRRREPLLQIMDEAARFIPQTIRAGDVDAAKCESVWSTIAEEGRNFGLGLLLLTQRSARLNKNVAELADVMMAFRTVGPNSVAAVVDWLGEHVDKKRINEIIQELRSLPKGTALVVSPGWLQLEKVVPMRRRHTFDSSETPKPGQAAKKVHGAGAKPDLAKYAELMKETIERAKADDPKALQARIRELEKFGEGKLKVAVNVAGLPSVQRALETAQTQLATLRDSDTKLRNENVELKRKLDDRQRKASKLVQIITNSMKPMVTALEKALQEFAAEAPVSPIASVVAMPPPVIPRPTIVAAEARQPSPERVAGDGRKLSGVALKIAGIAAGYAKRGESISKKLLATLCGSTIGGTFSARLSEARLAGAITTDGTMVMGTEQGISEYGDAFVAPSTTEEVVALWQPRLSGVSRAIFDTLVSLRGEGLTRAELAQNVGSTIGGTFSARLSEVRSTGLLVENGNTVAVNRELLFL